MSSLPQIYPRLSLHLTDRAHTPFISSPLSRRPPNAPTNTRAEASRQSQLQALHSLTTTALASHDAAVRLGLGLPSRIMVEHGPTGPVVLTSYVRARRKIESVDGAPAPMPVPGVAMRSGMGVSVPPAACEPGTAPALPGPSPRTPNPKPSIQSLLASPPTIGNNQASPLPLPSSPPLSCQAPTGTPTGTPASTPAEPLPHPDTGNGAVTKPSIPLSRQHTAVFPYYDEEDENGPLRPLLLSLVVSPSPDELPDARRAATRLERLGRDLQSALAEEDELGEDELGLVAPGPPGTEVGGDSAPGSMPGTVEATPGEVTTDEEG